ncbi:MAG: acyclic terpene utilization AtuA family protein [Rhizomicrobium sp.]
MESEIRYVAATGALGAGVNAEALEKSLEMSPAFIAADAGTTDAGPFSLGGGVPAFAREAVKRDLTALLCAARKAGIPALIGSAGTAGGDPHVDWVLAIAREIAAERQLSLRTAVIRSEQDKDYLLDLYREGRIRALDPAPELSEETIRKSARIVGMMGVEPLQEALEAGADFVLAGRCSDPALFAALPILRGFPAGLSWHAGKITECGTMACEGGRGGVITATIRHAEAILRPVGKGLRCTPQSIAAHSLYENGHPYLHKECSGTLDLTQSRFESVDAVSVRISGSMFIPAEDYTVKLEGAELVGYQSVMIGGIRDPYIIKRLDVWLSEVRQYVCKMVENLLGVAEVDWKLVFHVYGKNAVMGSIEPEIASLPHEVGIVVEATAATQDLASKAIQIARQPFLHHGIPEWMGGITSFACLHNPAHIDRGPVYRFTLNHVAVPRSPSEMFRTEMVRIGEGS